MGKLFSEIIGQKPSTTMLSVQLKSGKLAHAYLFLGDEGSGKSFLANALARNIFCTDLNEKASCDSCKKFDYGTHPDFIFISGDEGIKIEQIREAIERINLSPALSSYKVLLITHAENMGIEAANALLKTIEEPPADSIIVLTAISEKSLPQTIISRVQKIKLLPLEREDILQILQKDCDEKLALDIAFYAEGNVGEAKRLLASAEELKQKKKTYEDVLTVFKSKSIIEKFKIIEEYEKKKVLKNFFRVFSYILSESLKEEMLAKEQSHQLGLTMPEKVKLMEKILKTQEELEYNVSLRLALEEIILEQC